MGRRLRVSVESLSRRLGREKGSMKGRVRMCMDRCFSRKRGDRGGDLSYLSDWSGLLIVCMYLFLLILCF